ncbi:MAG: DUF4173 domain-containing protein [Pseudonocardiaceae bacterium]|nr:DUF4173 domain-containing protein [Pseudonocardiaceae bacterium]
MSAEHEQDTARRARAREVGLFRYGLISDALDQALSTKQRGRLVRAVAARTHPGPFGAPVRVSRASLDRWIRGYRTGGFAALVPAPRRVVPQTPTEVLELAVALKTEAPGRTAAQVAVVLAAHAGWAPSPRTLQRHFAALGMNRWRPDGTPPAVFGRFEAEAPNARWVGDALHGPIVAGGKAILIAFLDDHSRAVMAARWGHAENAVALRETLRDGLAARGRPGQCYVDNGSMFRAWIRVSLGLLCASTLVVVASALYRMHLYQEAYGFTRMRLLVDVFEGWLGVLVLVTMAAGVTLRARWLPRFGLISGVVLLLGLAALNPDAWIARQNLDRYQATGTVDWHYLGELSADAVPVIATLPQPLAECALELDGRERDDWLEWNLGRSQARVFIETHADDWQYREECPGQTLR